MSLVALVTLIILVQYSYFSVRAGMSRGKTVTAPAVSGDEKFERALRVQMNTLEQMAVTIPMMWICGHFFIAEVAAILGLVFVTGRALYSIGYISNPKSRIRGFVIGQVANVGLLGCSLVGIARHAL